MPDDEKLMDFLNSPAPSKGGAREGVGVSKPRRQSGPERATKEISSIAESSQPKPTQVKNETQSSQIDTRDRSRDKDAEIKALGTEITKLNKRNVELETEYKRLQKRLENWKTQFNESNKIIHEMETRESELKKQLHNKGSEIQALGLRINQLQEEMVKKQSLIARLEAENEGLKSNNEKGEDLQEKIKFLEQELEKERRNAKELQTQSMMMIGKREENERQLVDELSALQRELTTERKKSEQLQKELSMAQTKSTSIEAEFSEYKTKATKILQSKEELIRTLQSQERASEQERDDQVLSRSLEAQCNLLVVEMQQLQSKKDEFEKELDSLKSSLIPELEEKYSTIQEQLIKEEREKQDIELELRESRDELKRFQDDLRQTKETLTQRLQGRDAEIERLRKQLLSKRDSQGQDNNDLEARIKNLTENLIQKQQLLEQLHCEKHSLQLQLEKSESRLREAVHSASLSAAASSGGPMSHRSSSSSIIQMGFQNTDPSTSSLINRNRTLLDEDPFDGPVRRKVKRAYGHIDAFR
jgi:chromosome segregation ATPase